MQKTYVSVLSFTTNKLICYKKCVSVSSEWKHSFLEGEKLGPLKLTKTYKTQGLKPPVRLAGPFSLRLYQQ